MAAGGSEEARHPQAELQSLRERLHGQLAVSLDMMSRLQSLSRTLCEGERALLVASQKEPFFLRQKQRLQRKLGAEALIFSELSRELQEQRARSAALGEQLHQLLASYQQKTVWLEATEQQIQTLQRSWDLEAGSQEQQLRQNQRLLRSLRGQRAQPSQAADALESGSHPGPSS